MCSSGVVCWGYEFYWMQGGLWVAMDTAGAHTTLAGGVAQEVTDLMTSLNPATPSSNTISTPEPAL